MLCCRHIYIPFMQVVQLKFTHRKYIIHQNEYIISPINLLSLLFSISDQPSTLPRMGIHVKKKPTLKWAAKIKEHFSGQISKL